MEMWRCREKQELKKGKVEGTIKFMSERMYHSYVVFVFFFFFYDT